MAGWNKNAKHFSGLSKKWVWTIFEDKFFDFVYEDDFIKIINFYFENLDNPSVLEKTINICYKEKYQLSDIAKLIINNEKQITILKETSSSNYSGNGDKLENLNLGLDGLEASLQKYNNRFFN